MIKNKELIIALLMLLVLVGGPVLLALYYTPVPEYRRELTIRNYQDTVLEDFDAPIFNIHEICGNCVNLNVVLNNKTCESTISENTLWINLDLELGNNSGYIDFEEKKYLLRGRGR